MRPTLLLRFLFVGAAFTCAATSNVRAQTNQLDKTWGAVKAMYKN